MYFVGREKEIEQMKEALERGKNVIVSGKYGMGRTSLIKHAADAMKDRWRFQIIAVWQLEGEGRLREVSDGIYPPKTPQRPRGGGVFQKNPK